MFHVPVPVPVPVNVNEVFYEFSCNLPATFMESWEQI